MSNDAQKKSFDTTLKEVLLMYAVPRNYESADKAEHGAFGLLRHTGFIVKHRPQEGRIRRRHRQFVVSDKGAGLIRNMPDEFGMKYLCATFPDVREKVDKQRQTNQKAWDNGVFGPPCGCLLKLSLERSLGRASLRDPWGVTLDEGANRDGQWLTLCKDPKKQDRLLAIRYEWLDGEPDVFSVRKASERERALYEVHREISRILRLAPHRRHGAMVKDNPRLAEWQIKNSNESVRQTGRGGVQ